MANQTVISSEFRFVPSEQDRALVDLQATTNENGRFYKTPEGKKNPSVTTVIGYAKNAFFAEWREKNPKESRRTLSRGDALHARVENYLRGESPIKYNEMSLDGLNLFMTMKPQLSKINNIRLLEAPLYSDALGLAGRVDCIAEYNGVPSIIDFKGSTRKKCREDIENYFLQATAYAYMYEERTGHRITQIVILMACEDGTVDVWVDDRNKYKSQLKQRILDYRQHITEQ